MKFEFCRLKWTDFPWFFAFCCWWEKRLDNWDGSNGPNPCKHSHGSNQLAVRYEFMTLRNRQEETTQIDFLTAKNVQYLLPGTNEQSLEDSRPKWNFQAARRAISATTFRRDVPSLSFQPETWKFLSISSTLVSVSKFKLNFFLKLYKFFV